MKKMKFLLGVLGCFLLTLSFGVNKVYASDKNQTTNPSEYFTSLTAKGVDIDGQKNFDVLDAMNRGANGDYSTEPTSCVILPGEICIDSTVHLIGVLKDGVTVTYNNETITGSFDWEIKVTDTVIVDFKAIKDGDAEPYDFSVTLEGNNTCSFCQENPDKDDEVVACIEGGKTKEECIEEKCSSKTYCELDPTKDDEIKTCIEGGKTEEECVKTICTFCKEDPSKDKDVKKCIDEGGKETDCIQKICVKENPKTGITSPIVGIAGLIALVVANVLIFRKREN